VIGSGGVMIGIGFSEPLAIAINLLVNDFDPIARHSDNTLHVMRMVLERKFEYDNVAAANGTIGQHRFIPGIAAAKNELVYEQMIAHQQSGFHGLRRNLKGLDDEGSPKERQNYGHEQRFDIFANGGVGALLRAARGGAVFGNWRCFS